MGLTSDEYIARRVFERITNSGDPYRTFADAEVNAATMTQECALRVLHYLPVEHKFTIVEKEAKILEEVTAQFARTDLTRGIAEFGETYLDEPCFLLAQRLAEYGKIARLQSPADAHMASRVVDQSKNLILSTVTIEDRVYGAYRTVLLAGVA